MGFIPKSAELPSLYLPILQRGLHAVARQISLTFWVLLVGHWQSWTHSWNLPMLMAICLTPVLLVGLVVLFALLLAATGILASVPAVLYYSMPDVDWSLIASSPAAVTGLLVCGLFIVGIPVIGLLQLLLQSFNVWKPMSTVTKVILTLIWFISLVAGFIFLFNTSFIEGPIFWM